MDNTLTSTMREKSSSSSVEPSEGTLVEAAEEAQPTAAPTLPLSRYLILAGAYVPPVPYTPPGTPRH